MGRPARADRYTLRIPDRYAESACWRRRRAGRIDAVHPVFLVLGGAAALVHQALGQAEARGAEVARAARLSASATSTHGDQQPLVEFPTSADVAQADAEMWQAWLTDQETRRRFETLVYRRGEGRCAYWLGIRTLADRERVLGAGHPDTLTSRNNLAYAYESAGRLEEAIPLYERTLADRERVLDAGHPDTLTSRTLSHSLLDLAEAQCP